MTSNMVWMSSFKEIGIYSQAKDIGGTPTAMTTLNKVVNVEMLETISLTTITVGGKKNEKN